MMTSARRAASVRLPLLGTVAAIAVLVGCERGAAPSKPGPAVTSSPVAPQPALPPGPAPEGRSAPGNAEATAPSAPAPGSPTGLRAVAQSPSEVALAWSPSPGGASYEVLRDGARVGTSSVASLLDGGLRPGTRYCYAVRAVGDDGRASAPSATACAQTGDRSPPTPPAGVTVTAQPGNRVAIAWAPSRDDVGVVGYEVFRGTARVAEVRETAATESGVPTAEHCWTVKALDAAGNRSAGSEPVCAAIPDTTPPTAPTAVVAAAAGERIVDVWWKAAEDNVAVARYEVFREGAETRVATDLSVRETKLSPARRFCFVVRACDAAGNCSPFADAACATTPDLTAPTVPAALEAVPRSDVAVELRWGDSSDEVGVTGYEVRRGDRVLGSVASSGTFAESGLHPATRYCYEVRAHDAAGNRSEPAQACATTPDLTPPTKPMRAGASAISSTQVFVAWDPSTDDVGVKGYELLRDGEVVATTAGTRTRIRGLRPTQSVCFMVRAFDEAGNRSPLAGPACATTSDPANPSAPSDLRVSRLSETNVLLRWEPSEDKGVLYRVYSAGMKVEGMTRGTSYNPSGRVGAKANCYRVAAVDGSGRESPLSNEECAATGSGLTSAR